MLRHPRPAACQRYVGRLARLVLLAGGLAACRGKPTADIAGRPVWPTPADGALAPALAADPAAGARLFADHCTACHGTTGAGDGPLAAGLSPRPPDWTARGALRARSPATLFLAIRRGVLGSSMKRFDHILDETSTWDIVFHVWQMPVATGTNRSGADDYARHCAACHGATGRPPSSVHAPPLVRPEWVALTRAQLDDRLARAHPDLFAPIGDREAVARTAPIAEHIWSFLTVATDAPPNAAAANLVRAAGAPADDPSPCAATAGRSVAPNPVTVGAQVTVTARIEITCPEMPGPVDVVLAIDQSASMIGAPLSAAKYAADVFIDGVELGRTRVALVAFDDRATLLVPLSSYRSRLHGAVARIEVPPAAGTDIVRALSLAGQALLAGEDTGREGRVKAIVLLTDGQNNRGPEPVRQQALVQRGNGVHLTTVALGRRADVALLRGIAATPADFWHVVSPNDLAAVYVRIAARLAHLSVRQLNIDDRIGATLAAWPGPALPDRELRGDDQRWTIPAAASEPITITYGLSPSAVGRWPISGFTRATFLDQHGRSGEVAIPIPDLDVVRALPTPTPTPVPTRTAAPTPNPTAVASPTNAAAPSATGTLDGPNATPTATSQVAPTSPIPTDGRRAYLPIGLAGSCVPGPAPLDLVVVLDTSTTMLGLTASGRRKLDVAVEGIRRLADGLDGRGGARMALVRFDAAAHIWAVLSADLGGVRAALAAPIVAAQGSRIDLGLLAAAEQLGGLDPSRPRAVVLVSDGLVFGATEQAVLDAAGTLRAGGADIYAVVVGPYAAEALLLRVAGAPARVFDAGDGDALVRAFRALGGTLPCP